MFGPALPSGPNMIESISTDSSYEVYAPALHVAQGLQARTWVMSPTHPALAIMQPPTQQGGHATTL
jgi:hypothetical protein